MAVARITKNGLKPNTAYEVRLIIERRSDNDKVFYLFVDQNKQLIYATDILRKLITSYDWEEDLIRYEDAIDREFLNIFNDRFNKQPLTILRTDSKRNFCCADVTRD